VAFVANTNNLKGNFGNYTVWVRNLVFQFVGRTHTKWFFKTESWWGYFDL